MRIALTICLLALSLFAAVRVVAAPDESQIERGHRVYQKWCFPCHGPGNDKPGTIALAARGQKPAVLEDRTDLTASAIKTFVRHGVFYMPIFRKTEVSDADLDAIVAYLTRNNKRYNSSHKWPGSFLTFSSGAKAPDFRGLLMSEPFTAFRVN
jgi:mono/diheme cytochrome c family protein